MTWEIIMRVAARIESTHPAEALKLRLCASEVRHLERLADGLVAEALDVAEAVTVLARKQCERA